MDDLEPSDAEIAAFKAAWEAEGRRVGRGISAPGTKTRAGLKAAYAAREAECEHPAPAREMRGFYEVCTICGKGREIG